MDSQNVTAARDRQRAKVALGCVRGENNGKHIKMPSHKLTKLKLRQFCSTRLPPTSMAEAEREQSRRRSAMLRRARRRCPRVLQPTRPAARAGGAGAAGAGQAGSARQQEERSCSTGRAAAPGAFSAPGGGENKTCQDSSGPPEPKPDLRTAGKG